MGRAEEKLKKIPNNFVGLIPTDPPYGMSFMGKDWDKAMNILFGKTVRF
jgi:DNA modification methylase